MQGVIEQSGTLRNTTAGRRIRGVPRSTAQRKIIAGPSVISRNRSDGGYLVVFRNESTGQQPVLSVSPARWIAVHVERANHERETPDFPEPLQAQEKRELGVPFPRCDFRRPASSPCGDADYQGMSG